MRPTVNLLDFLTATGPSVEPPSATSKSQPLPQNK
jgi:hypothetical protein